MHITSWDANQVHDENGPGQLTAQNRSYLLRSEGGRASEKEPPLLSHCNDGLRPGSTPPFGRRAGARFRHASYSGAGPRQLQARRGARVCRNPAPLACAPSGLSRTEDRHCRRSAAIGLHTEQEQTMDETDQIDELDTSSWRGLSFEELAEERWEQPLKPREIVRAVIPEEELPY
jgi:hypothetical protein